MMFIIWLTRTVQFVLCNWFVPTEILLANSDELILKGHCHEDFAVLGQFCAEIIALKLYS